MRKSMKFMFLIYGYIAFSIILSLILMKYIGLGAVLVIFAMLIMVEPMIYYGEELEEKEKKL